MNLSLRELRLLLVLLVLMVIGMGVGWWLDRSHLAYLVEKTRYDFHFISGGGGTPEQRVEWLELQLVEARELAAAQTSHKK